ncbi:hypothetical protein [Nonomuraea zeae]|uniref:WXG100 family type VII secretion target n=1 Tax=Nonomuraea zeae TaxID=1642303 RepID=A0A5S4GT19_9ACTN|nr:hypothetical protein [Nonomuraea zeae]TMR35979.1 hypothetical protein ETD85_12205 [Nonomuraea zeae]
MGTGFVDVSYQAFDECRTRVRTASKEFDLGNVLKDSKSKAPAEPTSATLFGTLDGAHELAAKMDAAWTGIRVEMNSGQIKLESVERALDGVETNLRTAAAASGA